MARPFETLTESDLTDDGVRCKQDAEQEFAAIEEFFSRVEPTSKRFKIAKEFPMPTLAASYELATVYSLRALELAEGCALLIERGYEAAIYPVMRSLYELWMAVVYAAKNFEKLVVKGNKWEKFDALAQRLILGTNGRRQGPFAINIGQMVSAAEAEMRGFGRTDTKVGDDLATHHKQMYAELSDGSHPTQWGVIGHAEIREDGLGIRWHRKPREFSPDKYILDLALSLRLLREWLERLELTAGQIEEAAHRAESLDPSIRQGTVAFLRALLEDADVDLSPETRERVKRVLAHLEDRGAAE